MAVGRIASLQLAFQGISFLICWHMYSFIFFLWSLLLVFLVWLSFINCFVTCFCVNYVSWTFAICVCFNCILSTVLQHYADCDSLWKRHSLITGTFFFLVCAAILFIIVQQSHTSFLVLEMLILWGRNYFTLCRQMNNVLLNAHYRVDYITEYCLQDDVCLFYVVSFSDNYSKNKFTYNRNSL